MMMMMMITAANRHHSIYDVQLLTTGLLYVSKCLLCVVCFSFNLNVMY